MTPDNDVYPDSSKPLLVGKWPKPVEGNTISLYCDECGELYCEHRPEYPLD